MAEVIPTGQLDIFGAPTGARTRRYRRTDPVTSRVAAERNAALIAGQGALVLDAIKRYPGSTGTELGDILYRERRGDRTKWRYAASRRLPELAAKHQVRKGEPRERKGRREVTWWPL